MTISWNPETKRMVFEMSKVEGWNLYYLISQGHRTRTFVGEFLRAFNAMLGRGAKTFRKASGLL